MRPTNWRLLITCLLLLAPANFVYLAFWGKLVKTHRLLLSGIILTQLFSSFPQHYAEILSCTRASGDFAVYWLTLEQFLISFIGILLGGPDGGDFHNIPWTEHPFTIFLLTRLLLLSKSSEIHRAETLRHQLADVLCSVLMILQFVLFN